MSIEDMRRPPNLDDSEEILFEIGGKLGQVGRNNVIIVGTTDRILVREKRGKDVSEEEEHRCDIEIPVESIDIVRRSGFLTKKIEIVTENDVYELPEVHRNHADFVEELTEHLELEQNDYGDVSTGARTGKGIVSITAISVGLIGFLIGLVGILSGLFLSLTIIGIIPAIFMFMGSFLVIYVSWKLIEYSGVWAFGRDEEWTNQVESTSTA